MVRLIEVIVKPSSKKGTFIQPGLDGGLLVHVKEPAQDGKANKSVISAIARHFEVPKNSVQIAKGHTSKRKLVRIESI